VPARRAEPLRSAIPSLVFDCTIADAEHNDLYERPEFWSALGRAVQRIVGSDPKEALVGGRQKTPSEVRG
jgi:hypothetical protein